MANIKHVNSVVDREFRNRINQLIDSINAQGKSIQDLVAEGQLTPTQYAELIKDVNGLLKSGEVKKYDLGSELVAEIERVNTMRLNTADLPIDVEEMNTRTKQLFTGGAVAVVGENAVGEENLKPKSVSGEKLANSAFTKITDETKRIRNEEDAALSRHFNLYGDVKSGENPSGFTYTNASVEFVDNYSPIIPQRTHPKIMRFNVNVAGTNPSPTISSNANKFYDVSPDADYNLSAWFNLTDLLSLNTLTKFRPYIIYYNEGGSIAGSVELDIITQEELQTVGTKITKTANADTANALTFELEVTEKQGDWVYIDLRMKDLGSNVKRIRPYYPRFKGFEGALNAKLDLLNISLTEYEYSPYTVPFANKQQYEESKLLDEDLIIHTVSNIFPHGKSKWTGKKWYVFGDSNSQNSNVKTYHEFIEEIIGCEVTNRAIGGTGYISRGSGDNPPVYERVISTDSDADLITVMSGGNDYSASYPLGELGDTTLDTFYGALDLTFNALIDKYPLKTIAVFTQMRRRNEGRRKPEGATVEEQVYATLEMCKKYNLPVLNLYHEGGMYPWNDDYRDEMIPDGVHLSTEGQQALAQKVMSFIESL